MNNLLPQSSIEDFSSAVVTCSLPTEYGNFLMHVHQNKETGQESIALVMGELDLGKPVLCRIHSECLTGDIFHSLRCDCGPQLHEAMKKIAIRRQGVVIYLRQEGRGIGLFNKIKAYALQERGFDTVEANEQLGLAGDLRGYHESGLFLKYLGVDTVELLTNNPSKVNALESLGFNVDRKPLHVAHGPHNKDYLKTKKDKMGHLL